MLRGSSDPNGQRQAALSPFAANLDNVGSQASRKITRAMAKVSSKRDMVNSAQQLAGLAWLLPDVGRVVSHLLMIRWLLQVDAKSVQHLDKLVNKYTPKFAALSAKAQACVAGSCEVEVNPVVHLSLSRTVLKSWPDELLFQPLSFSRPVCPSSVFLLSLTRYESFRFGLRSWTQQITSSQKQKKWSWTTTLKVSSGLRWRRSFRSSRAERYEWCLVIAAQHMLALLL